MLVFWLTGTFVTYFAFIAFLYIATKKDGGWLKAFRIKYPEENKNSDACILTIMNIMMIIICFLGWPLLWLVTLFKIFERSFVGEKENG